MSVLDIHHVKRQGNTKGKGKKQKEGYERVEGVDAGIGFKQVRRRKRVFRRKTSVQAARASRRRQERRPAQP
jgi:hypothetical protein